MVPSWITCRSAEFRGDRPVDGQRLLDDDVGAGIQCPHDQRRVQVVARADHDPLHLLLAHHLLEVVGTVDGRRAEAGLGHAVDVVLRAHRVRLADRDEHCVVGVAADDRVDVHLGAVSRTDEGIPAVTHLTPSGNVFSEYHEAGRTPRKRRRDAIKPIRRAAR